MRGPTGNSRGRLARFRTLSERGFTRAAQSLGRMLGRRVRLTLRETWDLSSSTLPALADGIGGPMAGLRIRIHGEGGGWILILLPFRTVYRLLETLMGIPPEPHSLTEAEWSAVQEVGNVLASSFLSELGDLLGRRLLPSPPEIHVDDVAGLIRDVSAAPSAQGSEVVIVHAVLEDRERHLTGQVFVVPEVATLEPMAQAAPGEQGVAS